MDDRIKLRSINLKGFKSFNSLGQDIPIGDLTVLLGANGAGKSNLVSFFSMLNYLTTGALQRFIGESGSADSLLQVIKTLTPISFVWHMLQEIH
jgi:predicted ATPase